MTKLTLTIEGDATALARVLAILGDSAQSQPAPSPAPPAPQPTPPIPATPAPGAPPAPIPVTPPPPSPDDDEANDTAPTGNVDSTGLPWDERIHSNPAKLTGKGVWRKKRGVTDAEVNSVEAELRANAPPPPPAPDFIDANTPAPAPIPPAPPATPPQPVPPAPVPEAAQPAPQPPIPAPAPVPTPPAPVTPPPPQPVVPEAPAAPPAAPAPAATTDLDFTGFMQHISGKMQERGADGLPLITSEYLAAVAGRIASAYSDATITSITNIADKPHMIQYAVQLLTLDGRW